jgi:predicted enzyme related to lactoylglutathione lyase
MKNALNWFEIPTADIDRAAAFYEKMLAAKMRRESFGGVPHVLFTTEDTGKGAVGGALIQDTQRKPGASGTLIYLDAPNLDACLSRVRDAGGEITMPKTNIGEHGFIAVVRDTEGNLVGLHSHA